MIHCPHRHPYGEPYCTACQQDKAVAEYRKKALAGIDSMLSGQTDPQLKEQLLKLRAELLIQ